MIHPNALDTLTVRSVFVIESMQMTDKHKVATPANWKHGDDVIIVPAVSDDEANELFPNGFKTHKPYLLGRGA